MKVIIAGSREITDYELLKDCIFQSKFEFTSIISGAARGVDKLGEKYAYEHNIDLIKMPADWDRYGKSAGYRRNEDMAKIADGAIILWDGESKGTQHMINLAKEYNLRVYLYTVLR